MIKEFIAVLNSEIELSAEEVADILWLASIRQQYVRQIETSLPVSEAEPIVRPVSTPTSLPPASSSLGLKPEVEAETSFQAGLFPSRSQNQTTGSDLARFNKPFKFPGASAFRSSLAFMKALRPLLGQQLVDEDIVLDEVATVDKIVNERIWMVVLKPRLEPWLDLALVVEESASMLIWRQTILELQHFLQSYGLFRDVRTWGLLTDEQGSVYVRSGFGTKVSKHALNNPRELLEPGGRRLILLVTDCLSPIWYTGQILPVLDEWSNHGPMALVQMLPEWLWDRTALREASAVLLKGLEPRVANRKLSVIHQSPEFKTTETSTELESEKATAHSGQIKMPVLTLEPHLALAWSRMISGRGGVLAAGFLLDRSFSTTMYKVGSEDGGESDGSLRILTPKERVERFWLTASSIAWRLVGLLAASPTISLPVIRLIQETLLPESQQVHVAEVLLGGLLKPTEAPQADTDPDAVTYQFIHEEIRSLLLESSSVADTVSVLSCYIHRHFGQSLNSFVANLQVLFDSDETALEGSIRPFAIVASEVLKRQGKRYAEFVQAVKQQYGTRSDWTQPFEADAPWPDLAVLDFTTAQLVEPATTPEFLPLQMPEMEVVTIGLEGPPDGVEPFESMVTTIEGEDNTSLEVDLESFEFETATLEPQKTGSFLQETGWLIQKQRGQGWRFVERLTEEVALEMVAIPGGSFMMGSLESEADHRPREHPHHEVILQPFCIGRYPITQSQWQVVASYSQIDRELNLNPSRYDGKNRPVEWVSWEEAQEFCKRLSAHTGKKYCLPSEAQWEYACRARSEKAFFYSEYASPNLFNCRAGCITSDGKSCLPLDATSEVGLFPANSWGLYDMHGNVWEWCADDWHDNYYDAPNDGSAWVEEERDERRVIRGGAWNQEAERCRSASRAYYNLFHSRLLRDNNSPTEVGFRVCCSIPKI